jgi:hypothetical protein
MSVNLRNISEEQDLEILGNDNPELLKELKINILRLIDLGILTLREVSPLLHQIFLLI